MITKLETVCRNLGVPVQVLEVEMSPQLVRVRVEPGQTSRGKRTRLSAIRNRAPDIGLAIGAHPINTHHDTEGFWLEVPRVKRYPVSLSSITYEALEDKRLPVVLGIDVRNQPLVVDLAEPNTPHILVAGTTGSGKTMLLKSILVNLMLHTASWHMVVVDTKQDLDVLANCRRFVEFREPRSEQHFLARLFGAKGKLISNNIITTPRLAETILDGLYQLCQSRQPTNISEPRVMVFIDEYADLALASKEIQKKTVRLAQVGRSSGIHMILATQRPSREVVNGLIKANFPVRVALKVVTGVDSRVILDAKGAEKLLGKGDGLVLLNGELIRFQAPFVSDDMVRGAVRKDKQTRVEVNR